MMWWSTNRRCASNSSNEYKNRWARKRKNAKGWKGMRTSEESAYARISYHSSYTMTHTIIYSHTHRWFDDHQNGVAFWMWTDIHSSEWEKVRRSIVGITQNVRMLSTFCCHELRLVRPVNETRGNTNSRRENEWQCPCCHRIWEVWAIFKGIRISISNEHNHAKVLFRGACVRVPCQHKYICPFSVTTRFNRIMHGNQLRDDDGRRRKESRTQSGPQIHAQEQTEK